MSRSIYSLVDIALAFIEDFHTRLVEFELGFARFLPPLLDNLLANFCLTFSLSISGNSLIKLNVESLFENLDVSIDRLSNLTSIIEVSSVKIQVVNQNIFTTLQSVSDKIVTRI